MDSHIETTLLEITGKIYILVFISFIIELLDLCLDIYGEISANRSTGIDIDVEASLPERIILAKELMDPQVAGGDASPLVSGYILILVATEYQVCLYGADGRR